MVFQDHFVLLGPGDAYGEYLTEDIVGRPVTTFPSNPLEHVSMATYNSVDGFIVCGQDCFSWKEPAPSWSQMTTVSLPYLAIAVTQINLSDGRIWIVGGRKTSGSYGKCYCGPLYSLSATHFVKTFRISR